MKSIFFISLTFVLTYSTAFSQKIDLQKIDLFVNNIEYNNRGIGSISIFKDGKEVYNRSFGQAKLSDIQYDAETKYQIGSITKLMTATLIFKLVEEDRLKLDDKLSKFYSEIPNSDKISIKNLLEHSSGLGDFLEKNDSLTWLTEKVRQVEIFDEIVKQGVSFQPNEKINYSNSGYFLLARIIEKLYGKDYDLIVAEKIAVPLQLKNFSSITSETINIFPSYVYNDGWVRIKDLEFSNVIGVGDIVSTTKDLNTFLYNLFQFNILSKESVVQMKPNDINKETFGRGLMQIPFYEYISYGHAGDTYGTHTLASYNEQDNLGFSLAYNGERFPHNDIAIGILSIIYGKEYDFPNFNTITVKSEDLDKLVGIYSSPEFPLKLTISKHGNTLRGKATGQQEFILECYEKNKFEFEQVGLRLTFNPEENKLIMSQEDIVVEMMKSD